MPNTHSRNALRSPPPSGDFVLGFLVDLASLQGTSCCWAGTLGNKIKGSASS